MCTDTLGIALHGDFVYTKNNNRGNNGNNNNNNMIVVRRQWLDYTAS